MAIMKTCDRCGGTGTVKQIFLTFTQAGQSEEEAAEINRAACKAGPIDGPCSQCQGKGSRIDYAAMDAVVNSDVR